MESAPRFPDALRGAFEPISVLGAGGFGTVWKARDRKLDRLLALKVLTVDLDLAGWRRFEDEASVLARFAHPALVRLYDAGRLEDGAWLALELLEGETLDRAVKALDDPGRRRDQAYAWLVHVAEGLAAMHAEGVVHRDVKPPNLMVTRDRRAVLLDFGLARPMDRTAVTAEGRMVGTLAFSAPERLRGRDATPASDWYAWGVTLYAAIERRLPWGTATMLEALGGRPLPRPGFQTLGPGDPLRALIERCLATDPGDRPASLAELRDPAPAGASGEATIREERVSSAARPGTPPAIAITPSSPGPARRPVGAALALVGIASVLGFLAGRQAERPPGPLAPAEPPPAPRRASGRAELEEARARLAAFHPLPDPLAGRSLGRFEVELARWLTGGDAAEVLGDMTVAVVSWLDERDRAGDWPDGLPEEAVGALSGLLLVELDKDAMEVLVAVGALARGRKASEQALLGDPAVLATIQEKLEEVKGRARSALSRIEPWKGDREPLARLLARTQLAAVFARHLLEVEAEAVLARLEDLADPVERAHATQTLLSLVGWNPIRKVLRCEDTERVYLTARAEALASRLPGDGPEGRAALLARTLYRWMRVADDCTFPIDEEALARLAEVADALVADGEAGRGWKLAMEHFANIHSNHPTLLLRLPQEATASLVKVAKHLYPVADGARRNDP